MAMLVLISMYLLFIFIIYLSLPVRSRACGWFMLQAIMAWDGECLTDFTMRDIHNIKKAMLYTWSVSGRFKIDFMNFLAMIQVSVN